MLCDGKSTNKQRYFCDCVFYLHMHYKWIGEKDAKRVEAYDLSPFYERHSLVVYIVKVNNIKIIYHT